MSAAHTQPTRSPHASAGGARARAVLETQPVSRRTRTTRGHLRLQRTSLLARYSRKSFCLGPVLDLRSTAVCVCVCVCVCVQTVACERLIVRGTHLAQPVTLAQHATPAGGASTTRPSVWHPAMRCLVRHGAATQQPAATHLQSARRGPQTLPPCQSRPPGSPCWSAQGCPCAGRQAPWRSRRQAPCFCWLRGGHEQHDTSAAHGGTC
jgi:hypothetical protein